MGGGFDYLATAEGLVDQWQYFLGVWTMLLMMGGHMPWTIICGIFTCCTFVVILLKIFGVNIPKTPLLIYYIIGAIVILLTSLIIGSMETSDKNVGFARMHAKTYMSTGISQGIFFIYGAIICKDGK